MVYAEGTTQSRARSNAARRAICRGFLTFCSVLASCSLFQVLVTISYLDSRASDFLCTQCVPGQSPRENTGAWAFTYPSCVHGLNPLPVFPLALLGLPARISVHAQHCVELPLFSLFVEPWVSVPPPPDSPTTASLRLGGWGQWRTPFGLLVALERLLPGRHWRVVFR